MLERMFHEEIHCYRCKGDEKRETHYTHHCAYVGCDFQSADYVDVYKHRTKAHQWGPRIGMLGPFWARLKEEVHLATPGSDIANEMPVLSELLGLHFTYHCPECHYSSRSEKAVRKHAKQVHRQSQVELVEASFEYKLESEVQLEQELTNVGIGEQLDQSDTFEKARQRLDILGPTYSIRNCTTRADLETMYTKILQLKDLDTCSLALIDIRRYRIENQDAFPLIPPEKVRMTSNIIELLHACPADELPHITGHKECPLCHLVYPRTIELETHMKSAHQQTLEPNAQKRVISNILQRDIMSMYVNALHECNVEEYYPLWCPVPDCTYRGRTHEQLTRHLTQVKNLQHVRAFDLINRMGPFWGVIKAYTETYRRLPRVRDMLGYTNRPHTMCKLCRNVVSTKKLATHMQGHPDVDADPEQCTEMVKFWIEFAGGAVDPSTVTEEWKNLLWNGTRAEIEKLTDYMWGKSMEETPSDEEETLQIEAELLQQREERRRKEEERLEHQTYAPNIDDIEDTVEIAAERSSSRDDSYTSESEEEPVPRQRILGLGEVYKYIMTEEPLGNIIQALRTNMEPCDQPLELDDYIVHQIDRLNIEAFRKGYACHHCEYTARNESALYTHLTSAHNVNRSDWFLMALEEVTGYRFTAQILSQGEELPRLVSCCWHPNCKYIQADKSNLNVHIKHAHATYYQDIQEYGIVLATIRAYMRTEVNTTWTDILQDRECMICECGGTFTNESSVNRHWAHAHNKETVGNWRAAMKPGIVHIHIDETPRPTTENGGLIAPLNQRRLTARENAEEQRQLQQMHTTDAAQQQDYPQNTGEEEEPAVPAQQASAAEIESETVPQNSVRRRRHQRSDSNAVIDATQPADQYWCRRNAQLRDWTDAGLNMLSIRPEHVPKIKEGLTAFFRDELIPLITSDDTWEAYEGRYMESLHIMREHITIKQGRDPEKIYKPKTRHPEIDKMILRALNHQEQETKLHNILKYIDKLMQLTQDDRQTERKRRTYLAKIQTILEHCYPDKSSEILEEIQGDEEQRQRALEWIRSMIVQAAQNKRECCNTRTTARVIQKSYYEDPGTTFRRYINPTASPTCTLDIDEIETHYANVWAKDTAPPPQVTSDMLNTRLEDDFSEEIIKFMTCEENIKKVLQTRNKLSALGPDGVGYRIYQLAGKVGIQYLKTLFQRVLQDKKIPHDWLEARTILLHKKGDEKALSNWRPISITCCTYRLFTALMSRALQTLNQKHKFYSSSQKGFIEKCNGCTEHSILLNELMAHARRSNDTLIATAIDCTNAFGSVPHSLIFDIMEKMNLPSVVRTIVKRMYTGATTKIETKSGTTSQICWRKGVKQGCPLSPLLFNLCLEPLLHTLSTQNRNDGVIIKNQRLQVQAYADDIVLVSQTPQGMRNLIRTTEEFMKWSLMTINPAKCTCASYMFNQHRRRCAIDELHINDTPIQCLSLAESCRYLGSPLAANARARMKATAIHVTETEVLLEKVTSSPLTINQKLHAIKTFVIPHLDFRFLNTEVSTRATARLDKRIRGRINKMFKVSGIPVANIHASWRDGGLSIPSLQDRQDVLCIRAFQQMYESSDETVRELLKTMIESEKNCRKVSSDVPGPFLDWNEKSANERKGNRCLISRTRKASERRGIQLKDVDGRLNIEVGGKKYRTSPTSQISLGRFLTSHIRLMYVRERAKLPLTCDRLTEAINNPESNYMIHGARPFSDALVRFMVAGRLNRLPTRHNIEKWYQKPHTPCSCGGKGAEHQTLAHLLNSCNYQRGKIIERHDKIIQILKEIIAEKIPGAALDGENQVYREVDGPNKPDLVITTDDQILILDATCPYGGTQHGSRAVQSAFEKKITKYSGLKKHLEEVHEKRATIIPVVVSSLGLVLAQSMTLLKVSCHLDDTEIKQLKKRLSVAALSGSYKIWREHILAPDQDEEADEDLRTAHEEEHLVGDPDPAREELEREEEEEETHETPPMEFERGFMDIEREAELIEGDSDTFESAQAETPSENGIDGEIEALFHSGSGSAASMASDSESMQ